MEKAIKRHEQDASKEETEEEEKEKHRERKKQEARGKRKKEREQAAGARSKQGRSRRRRKEEEKKKKRRRKEEEKKKKRRRKEEEEEKKKKKMKQLHAASVKVPTHVRPLVSWCLGAARPRLWRLVSWNLELVSSRVRKSNVRHLQRFADGTIRPSVAGCFGVVSGPFWRPERCSLELVSSQFTKQRLAPWIAGRGPNPPVTAMVFWACERVLWPRSCAACFKRREQVGSWQCRRASKSKFWS